MSFLTKSIVSALLSVACVGLVFGDTGKIEWFQNLRPDSALEQLENSQLIVRYRPPFGGEVFGLAFFAEGRLLSASHVYSQIKVGDEVEIGRHRGLGSEVTWSKATLVALSPMDDLAILIPHDRSVLANNGLSFCQQSARPGTLLVTTKFLTDGAYIQSGIRAPVVTTSLKLLPRVNAISDQLLQPGQIPLSAMAGQLRIVAAGSAAGGHSGGALFDVERKCVEGVVSANAYFDWLVDRDFTLHVAGNPPYFSFIIGVPIKVVRSFLSK